MNRFDLIVVGGGPAGTTAATVGVQHGLRVALFEHARFPRHKVCGDVINPNCWPVLERIGAAEKVRALPHHTIDGALFTASGNNTLPIPAPQPLVAIRRSLFDSCLLEHARSCGVIVFEAETVHAMTGGNEVITGSGHFVSRRGIIGADGRHSAVARMSGLALRRDRTAGPVAFQSHFRAPLALDSRIQLHLFPGGYCGVVRVDEERANLCLVTERRNAQHHKDCEALFSCTVQKNPHFRALNFAPIPLEPLRSAFPLCAPMNVPAKNSVFLVGDALRVVEPFTGQGIFFALRTAELAARVILDSRCPETAYAAAVSKLYDERTQTNRWLRRLMYHDEAAGWLMAALKFWPVLRRWLAGNVFSADKQSRADYPAPRAPWQPEPMR
jgi:menaquinone-9 beta-reductase